MNHETSRRAVLGLAGIAAAGWLTGCGDDPAPPPTGSTLPTQGGPSTGPDTAGDLVGRLASYPSDFRFTPANSVHWSDEPGRARAIVAMRVETVKFLGWAAANGHPDILPALPGPLVGQEYLLDSLVGNEDSLDTRPLPGAREPFGRLIPDQETVKSQISSRQAGFLLTMLKTVMSRQAYARLVTDSPLRMTAAGKNILDVYPYSTPNPVGGTDQFTPTGIREAFAKNRELRWLIANPGENLTADEQRRLIEGGGTLHNAEGFRVIHLDSSRGDNVPATLARSLYDAFTSVLPA